MLDNISVGNQIAALRKQKGYTQEELADELEISAQAISKWENGHTLPETALLPLLAELLDCTIDSILTPFAERDSAFKGFARAVGGEQGELALALYQRMKRKFDFTISYKEEYNIFDEAFKGASAVFNNPNKDDFIIRMDVEAGGVLSVRLSLQNCSGYIPVIDNMPEFIKKKFRDNDCKGCQCKCPYRMEYTFEGVDYRQCHYITVRLDSAENMKHILTLLRAEHESAGGSRTR